MFPKFYQVCYTQTGFISLNVSSFLLINFFCVMKCLEINRVTIFQSIATLKVLPLLDSLFLRNFSKEIATIFRNVDNTLSLTNYSVLVANYLKRFRKKKEKSEEQFEILNLIEKQIVNRWVKFKEVAPRCCSFACPRISSYQVSESSFNSHRSFYLHLQLVKTVGVFVHSLKRW